MSNNPRRFPRSTRFFTWSFLFFVIFGPLILMLPLALQTGNAACCAKSLIWAGANAAAFLYARWRCASPRLLYLDGLMYTAYSMTVWGFGTAALLILPALLMVFLASVFIALVNEVRRTPQRSAEQYLALVRFVFRHRMIQ
jgi:hypothetical protein